MVNPATVTFVISLALVPATAAQHAHPSAAPAAAATATTSLSAETVQQLLEGDGMGLATPAELNQYPGPRHVLDLKEPLRLTSEQARQVEAIRQQMLVTARGLGEHIVAAERALDAAFRSGRITDAELAERVAGIARLQGELRIAHLRAHLATRPLLSADQIRTYYEHRHQGH